ncbi:TolB family protein [Maricaulis parjimensis]|uniref:TolB family protein n=1 Tax=Maricaulis parjimensis TaxID=144023 RepID=UPI00193A5EB0|nr:PD40 domain-containing protein [Maricaulis parjimensis]
MWTGFGLAAMALGLALEEDVSTYDTWGVWDRDGQALIGYTYRFGDAELVRISVETGTVELITDNEGNDWFPDVTRDGRYIVFVSDRDYGPFEGSDIYVLDRATGEERRVTHDGAMKLGLSVSPDGESIVFPATGEGGANDIWRVGFHGGEPENLTRSAELDERNPSFGPDGQNVWMSVGEAGADRATGAAVLASLDLETGLVRERLNLGGQAASPRLNAAGDVLLTYRNTAGNRNIARFDPDTGEVVVLTRHEASDHAPFWSPDGHQISFSTYRWGDSEIYLMAEDGSGMRNLTRTTADAD